MALHRFHGPDAAFWCGRRVLLTGHTGFKGSWLALWLLELGAEVTGLALPPEPGPSLFEALGWPGGCSTGSATSAIRRRCTRLWRPAGPR